MNSVLPGLRSIAGRAGLLLLCCWAQTAGAATPSTFGSTVGNTLLCMNQINEQFFYDYFSQAFGKPYKREGGAYWFKADANLWGVPVPEVMVSEAASPWSFVAAVVDVPPEQLDEAVVATMGLRHQKMGLAPFPVREAAPGSQIVYFQKKSKIFCAKQKWLVPY